MRNVAALFVATDGAYFGLEGVDPWDEARDARLYDGPDPVVAHPPCQLWTNFAALNFKRWGGWLPDLDPNHFNEKLGPPGQDEDPNKPGNDGGCFASALKNVERFGGVVEHPAFTKAYATHGLLAPHHEGWCQGAAIAGTAFRCWTCEVWQSAYGHRARKRTWLYFVGERQPPELNWQRKQGTAQVGGFDRIKPVLSKQEASATPIAFRDALINLARSA